MLVSMNWIREYVNLDGLDIKKLINSFTLATAEVEDIFDMGTDVKDVVVGEIKTLEKHPDSKKLHLLTIDAGDRIYNCVCGAPNVEVGQKVAFVKAGGRVIAGDIVKTKVAGYDSEGMCCSESELGISDDHSGLMYIPPEAKIGTSIKELFPIDDTVFEVDNKSLTNRPDLWGHYGIAREFAALAERELKPLELSPLDYDGDEKISVEIGRPDLVYRYACLKMTGITKTVSPEWMRIRLFYCGMRPINLLADLTNYIMLEIGQPTHAFDAKKIDRIVVTTPKEKTKFTTLDKVERDIDENTLMIMNGDTPVAIAGIMGGLDSEIVGTTDSVVLECANFDGISVRKSSSRLAHRTDSSARYEKMLDPELVSDAAGRFVKLLTSIDNGAYTASRFTDEYPKKYPEVVLTFDKSYVDRYTGIEISCERIVKTLTALGFSVEQKDGEFTVKVPSWRATKDVTIKADIIEEITRIYGYDNFNIATTRSPLKPVGNTLAKDKENEIKDILVKKYSLHEVHSYLWCDGKKFKKLGIETEDNVKVLNIENSDNGVLRNSMIPTLLAAVYENRDYSDSYGMFEIGRVINGTNGDGTCREEKHLGIVLFSKTESEKSLYLKAVSIVNCLCGEIIHSAPEFAKIPVLHAWQHPKNTAGISMGGTSVGYVCALHPLNAAKLDKTGSAVCIELNADSFYAAHACAVHFSEPSAMQGTYYDLSLVLPEKIRFSQLEASWKLLELPSLVGVKVIDTFERVGLRSMTLRFSFELRDRTLEMDEVQTWIDQILKNLSELGVVIRA